MLEVPPASRSAGTGEGCTLNLHDEVRCSCLSIGAEAEPQRAALHCLIEPKLQHKPVIYL